MQILISLTYVQRRSAILILVENAKPILGLEIYDTAVRNAFFFAAKKDIYELFTRELKVYVILFRVNTEEKVYVCMHDRARSSVYSLVSNVTGGISSLHL